MPFAHIFCSHIEQTVCVNSESYIHTFFTCWRWSDAFYREFGNLMVISCQECLSLKNINIECFLVFVYSTEALCPFCWDRCVPVDNAAHLLRQAWIMSLYAVYSKRKWSHIEHNDAICYLVNLTREDPSHNCCSVSYCLIRIHLLVQIFSIEEVL